VSEPVPVFLGPVLLGRRVELVLAGSYKEERGVVIGLSPHRSIRLVPEHAARYDAKIGAWLPTRPLSGEWVRHRNELLRVTVLDVP